MDLPGKIFFLLFAAGFVLCPAVKPYSETYIDLHAVSFVTSEKGNITLSRDKASVKPGNWAVHKKNFRIERQKATGLDLKLLMKFRLKTGTEGFTVNYTSSAEILNKPDIKPVEKSGERKLRRGNSMLIEIIKIPESSKRVLFSLTPTTTKKYVPPSALNINPENIKQVDFQIVLSRLRTKGKKEVENSTLRTGLKKPLDFKYEQTNPRKKEESVQMQKEVFTLELIPQKIKDDSLNLKIKVRAVITTPFSKKEGLSIEQKDEFEISASEAKTLKFKKKDGKGFICRITPKF